MTIEHRPHQKIILIMPISPPIAAIKHSADNRTKISTEELRDFVAEDEDHLKAMLYPRDPSLDPQLMWEGKANPDTLPQMRPMPKHAE